MPTLSLVIPAYNEESRLPSLLDVLAKSAEEAVDAAGFDLLEALVVNDGSDDRTAEILAAAGRSQPKLVPVLDCEENRGKGAAVALGVDRAAGDYVLVADVDLSTPLDELPKLAAAVRAEADIAIGSRAVPGAVVERGPVHRKLLGKAFNGTVRVMTGLRVRDTQCGFKLMSTDVARLLLVDQTCPGFAFDVELLMRADALGLRIAEVPVLYIHDSSSRVQVASASLQMLKDVSSLSYRLRLRGKGRPDSEQAARLLAGLSADDSC